MSENGADFENVSEYIHGDGYTKRPRIKGGDVCWASEENDSGNQRIGSPIADSTITEKWKWLFVKFYEYKNQISTPP